VLSPYLNIDTRKAIIALDLLLREAKVVQIPLLVQFTQFILGNNFIKSEFSIYIYYMAVCHKDWELRNSRIWLAEIDIKSGLDFPI